MSRMRVTEHAGADAFLERAGAFLAAREAEHVLPLRAAWALHGRARAEAARAPLLWTVDGPDGATEGALVLAGARKAALSTMSAAAARLLATHAALRVRRGAEPGLAAPGEVLSGVVGPEEAARAFAGEYAARLGLAQRDGLALRSHECRAVTTPPSPGGEARAAAEVDRPTLLAWIGDFARHSGERPGEAELARALETMLREGRLLLWRDEAGAPVSMAASIPGTPRSASISYVFTPEIQRRRGFAAALTARLTDRLLASGMERVSLFTDRANPTSNAIYARIGFVPRAEAQEVIFTPRGAS